MQTQKVKSIIDSLFRADDTFWCLEWDNRHLCNMKLEIGNCIQCMCLASLWWDWKEVQRSLVLWCFTTQLHLFVFWLNMDGCNFLKWWRWRHMLSDKHMKILTTLSKQLKLCWHSLMCPARYLSFLGLLLLLLSLLLFQVPCDNTGFRREWNFSYLLFWRYSEPVFLWWRWRTRCSKDPKMTSMDFLWRSTNFTQM